MADVKWIKIMTDIFDNRKIRQIETMPEGDAILVIWFKLLAMAGKVNDGGLIYLTENIPYTDEMLSTQFNKPLMLVRLALSVFDKFGMIERDEHQIFISSWEKYQSTDKMAAIREYNRLAQQKSREKRKLLPPVNDMSMISQPCHDTDIEEEEDIEEESKNGDIGASAPPPPSEISHKPKCKQCGGTGWILIPGKNGTIKNEKCDCLLIKEVEAKILKHKYGAYQNVLLSDDDMAKLQSEYPDWEQRIERLSEYIASKGAKYKNHLATIRAWARKDKEHGGTKLQQTNRSDPGESRFAKLGNPI